jgi:hypothetical protein
MRPEGLGNLIKIFHLIGSICGVYGVYIVIRVDSIDYFYFSSAASITLPIIWTAYNVTA